MVIPKPKHVATILKQSNYFNYSVVMSDCLSLFILPRLTIYRAVHLANCYLSCYAESFVNFSRRFERSQLHHLSRSVIQRMVHITTAEIRRLSAVRVSYLSLSLSLTFGLQNPQSCSAPSHVGCSARSYTAPSNPSLFPTQVILPAVTLRCSPHKLHCPQ